MKSRSPSVCIMVVAFVAMAMIGDHTGTLAAEASRADWDAVVSTLPNFVSDGVRRTPFGCEIVLVGDKENASLGSHRVLVSAGNAADAVVYMTDRTGIAILIINELYWSRRLKEYHIFPFNTWTFTCAEDGFKIFAGPIDQFAVPSISVNCGKLVRNTCEEWSADSRTMIDPITRSTSLIDSGKGCRIRQYSTADEVRFNCATAEIVLFGLKRGHGTHRCLGVIPELTACSNPDFDVAARKVVPHKDINVVGGEEASSELGHQAALWWEVFVPGNLSERGAAYRLQSQVDQGPRIKREIAEVFGSGDVSPNDQWLLQFATSQATDMEMHRLWTGLEQDASLIDDPCVRFRILENKLTVAYVYDLFVAPLRRAIAMLPIAEARDVNREQEIDLLLYAAAVAEMGAPPEAVSISLDLESESGLLRPILFSRWKIPCEQSDIALVQEKLQPLAFESPLARILVETLLRLGQVDLIGAERMDDWFERAVVSAAGKPWRWAELAKLSEHRQGCEYLLAQRSELLNAVPTNSRAETIIAIARVLNVRAKAARKLSRYDVITESECQQTMKWLDTKWAEEDK